MLSGLTSEQRDEISRLWLINNRAQQVRAIDDPGEAIDVLEAAVNFAQSAMYQASGSRSIVEFETWLSGS